MHTVTMPRLELLLRSLILSSLLVGGARLRATAWMRPCSIELLLRICAGNDDGLCIGERRFVVVLYGTICVSLYVCPYTS